MRKILFILGNALAVFSAITLLYNPTEAADLEEEDMAPVEAVSTCVPAPEVEVEVEVTAPQDAGVSPTPAETQVVNGLLRICVSESGFFSPQDCVGIWQVIKNTRSRSCSAHIRKITGCNADGETYLSVMRRHSPISMGQRPAPTARKRYIQRLTVNCEEPPGFESATGNANWERYREACLELAQLARALVTGTAHRRFPVPSVIAWGGRCEVQGGACDDAIACSRGLARVDSATRNAFWCTPGARGCEAVRDPLCAQFDL